MFKKKRTKDKKKGFSVEFNRGIKKAEDIAKKDINIIKQDVEKGVLSIKKMDNPKTFSFFLTYGWAIIAILICVLGFIWLQYFSVHSESCDFLKGSGFLCENFDVTNQGINVEIRNLNNKSVTINKIDVKSCSISPEQKISDNDKKMFEIPCKVSSGRFKEKIVVTFKIEDFQKHTVAKLSKIVP